MVVGGRAPSLLRNWRDLSAVPPAYGTDRLGLLEDSSLGQEFGWQSRRDAHADKSPAADPGDLQQTLAAEMEGRDDRLDPCSENVENTNRKLDTHLLLQQ